jgi:hypothetical protein
MNNANDKISENTLNGLLKQIQEKKYKLEDELEITAILESMGWTDKRVADELGYSDVFELANELWLIYKSKVYTEPATRVEKVGFVAYTIMVTRSFLRGAIFALPMAISVFAMLTLRFSLWSSYEISTEIATSIALGTIMSFIVIGGFTQAIARRGFMYVMLGYYNMARKITRKFIRIGYYTVFIMTVLFIVLNIILNAFSMEMMWYIALFFFFLSSIWLSITVMYILEKELFFTGLVILGIAIVFILYKLLGMYILWAQLIALAIVSIIGTLFVRYIFAVAELKMEKGIHPELPRMSIIIYSILSYFIYGFLYFSLLFTDRVISWSTNNKEHMPYLIWFRGEYELGLDFALLTLIVPMGLGEVMISRLMKDITSSQKNYMLDKTKNFNEFHFKRYVRALLFITVFSIISAIFIYLLVWWIQLRTSSIDTPLGTLIQIQVIGHRITHPVFVIALISYTFIAIGLMNAVVLFSLSYPDVAAKNTFFSLILNIVIGFLLSRWIEYHWGVIGLLVGSLLFMILMIISTVKVIKNLDYHIYAAS